MTDPNTEPAQDAPPEESVLAQFDGDTGGALDFFMNPEVRDVAWKAAQRLSETQLVPAQFYQKPADCFIALEMAARLGDSPIVILQNVNIIKGKPSLSAAYSTHRLNKSGLIEGSLKFRSAGSGKDLSVTAYCIRADDGEALECTATMEMARLEGWTSNGKYKSMPEHMLRYRAATLLIRAFFPSVIYGFGIDADGHVGYPGGQRASGRTRPSSKAADILGTPDPVAEKEAAEDAVAEPVVVPEPEPTASGPAKTEPMF